MTARLEPWLRTAAKAVEVVRESTVADVIDDHPVWTCGNWLVFISNGESGEAWEGALVARCQDEQHGALVAEALRLLAKRDGAELGLEVLEQ
jgi:hypothetical protein